MGGLLEGVWLLSLAGMGSLLHALRSVHDRNQATAKRPFRDLLQECTADLNWHILRDAPKADFLAQQSLRKSTDTHIIIVCLFQCKMPRPLLTHIQRTWVHNPRKQTRPSLADIANYNIWNKINSSLAFVTLSACDTFLTSWLILKKIRIQKARQVL